MSPSPAPDPATSAAGSRWALARTGAWGPPAPPGRAASPPPAPATPSTTGPPRRERPPPRTFARPRRAPLRGAVSRALPPGAVTRPALRWRRRLLQRLHLLPQPDHLRGQLR